MQERKDKRNDVFISKKMSYCLRHNPDKYGLQLDEYGFVDLQDFLKAMNRMHHFQPKLTEMKIREIMQASDKVRFEIKNGKICALYGHSVPGIIKRQKATPPDVLYHGTAHRFLASIEKEGLLPMGRQYVHLSTDIAMAESVGKRRDQQPAILMVDAKQAHADGIDFYVGNDEVWLCDQMPSKYLHQIK
ncbi:MULTISPECIES: RNA 2'-phosphotransferase [Lactobacillus]|uniref:Probable RNA 2'-phosphotransferase n=1 Tax=Lactobacillus xujianguonis TaxID=2495899 RepID=A0A437SW41_9LACO|nr:MULTISPECIES: RNA 2'-phosphotransferase [Lactobacillus]RVU71144.1 RNA 2'-phosphotransferase [Lactobacillus xujianguonis]RVU77491.1 RNA 2'-phosphotransferase [Lactobacillus xujianguonis]